MKTDNASKDLIPTKKEMMEIFARISQDQIENPDPMSLPGAVLRAWTDCVMRKAVNRGRGEFDKAFNQFKSEVDKSAEQLDKAINQYKDELEKAIKRFGDGANL